MSTIVLLMLLGVVGAAGVWAYREGYLDNFIAKFKKKAKKK